MRAGELVCRPVYHRCRVPCKGLRSTHMPPVHKVADKCRKCRSLMQWIRDERVLPAGPAVRDDAVALVLLLTGGTCGLLPIGHHCRGVLEAARRRAVDLRGG